MDLSIEYIIASSVVSTVGLGYFIYGKKSGKTLALVSGLVMMVFPIFVSDVLSMTIITVILGVLPLFG